MKNYNHVSSVLQKFLSDYLEKSGAENFVVGVSGGLDSAVVATLCSLVKPKNTHALIMPSKFSNRANLDDALRLCDKLDIKRKIIEIEPILDSFKRAIGEEMSNLRNGNLAARARMILLYDYCASVNGLVVGTSNKSELMLGYSTIYGDLAYALNPIGGLFKSEIFEFAKFLGIDESIVSKAPSADFYEGQSDEADMGYGYDKIDRVLMQIEKKESKEKLLDKFDNCLVDMIFSRMSKNKFKLSMPPIAIIN
ncbi:NAD+ synthase [Campylobacter sp.]|uniref:NAD+ synthase n=1 Tax=Campylobacter sp. TaxID=205 RepID=UPI0027077EFC|nr:NAD+ synthase [Campylobacter sp.]